MDALPVEIILGLQSLMDVAQQGPYCMSMYSRPLLLRNLEPYYSL
jgi:hypothetical protein